MGRAAGHPGVCQLLWIQAITAILIAAPGGARDLLSQSQPPYSPAVQPPPPPYPFHLVTAPCEATYEVFSPGASWAAAQATCERLGGALPGYASPDEIGTLNEVLSWPQDDPMGALWVNEPRLHGLCMLAVHNAGVGYQDCSAVLPYVCRVSTAAGCPSPPALPSSPAPPSSRSPPPHKLLHPRPPPLKLPPSPPPKASPRLPPKASLSPPVKLAPPPHSKSASPPPPLHTRSPPPPPCRNVSYEAFWPGAAWQDAHASCIQLGGVLAGYSSPEDHLALNALLASKQADATGVLWVDGPLLQGLCDLAVNGAGTGYKDCTAILPYACRFAAHLCQQPPAPPSHKPPPCSTPPPPPPPPPPCHKSAPPPRRLSRPPPPRSLRSPKPSPPPPPPRRSPPPPHKSPLSPSPSPSLSPPPPSPSPSPSPRRNPPLPAVPCEAEPYQVQWPGAAWHDALAICTQQGAVMAGYSTDQDVATLNVLMASVQDAAGVLWVNEPMFQGLCKLVVNEAGSGYQDCGAVMPFVCHFPACGAPSRTS